jgi:hypothetical protein
VGAAADAGAVAAAGAGVASSGVGRGGLRTATGRAGCERRRRGAADCWSGGGRRNPIRAASMRVWWGVATGLFGCYDSLG